jgi:hypothetical protein
MITTSNLSSPPVYQTPKEQGNQKRKIQRDSRKPPLEKKHTRRPIAEMPSQGIRKVMESSGTKPIAEMPSQESERSMESSGTQSIAEVPKSRNQKGEWKALGQNQLQRYPSQGIRKVNRNALGQIQLKRYPVKESER